MNISRHRVARQIKSTQAGAAIILRPPCVSPFIGNDSDGGNPTSPRIQWLRQFKYNPSLAG